MQDFLHQFSKVAGFVFFLKNILTFILSFDLLDKSNLNERVKMTLKNELSVRKLALSVEDILKYGAEGGTYIDKDFDHRFLLIKIPSVPAARKGKKTARGKAQVVYYDIMTKEVGIGLASDFFEILPGTLPTLDKVIKWKEREANLSAEERKLLLASINHGARILGRSNSTYNQEEREQAFGFLIKNEPMLKRAIENERKYQSLSRIERTFFDQIAKEKEAKKEKPKTRSYIIKNRRTERSGRASQRS